MEEPKSKNNVLKSMLVACAMIGSLYVGDRYEPFKGLGEKSFYHNSSIEDGYYQKPLDLEIISIRNEKNRVEVYLVDHMKQDSLAISDNMRVGTTGGSIDEFVDDKKSGIKNWWNEQKTDSTKFVYKLKEKF